MRLLAALVEPITAGPAAELKDLERALASAKRSGQRLNRAAPADRERRPRAAAATSTTRTKSWSLTRGKSGGPRDWENSGDSESPLHPVMLGDRDVVTDGEAVTIESEDRFLLFLVVHVVVMARPMMAAMMDEVTVRVVLAGPEPMQRAGAPPRVPALRI
jgi:hypothetical protein